MLLITRMNMVILITISLLACQTNKIQKQDFTKFYLSDPKSILIVPAINRSVDVDAPDYFLSTIAKPLAERGYYVFPVNLVKRLMEDDGLSDADMVHNADPTRLGELFGTDAILYVSIDRWETQYFLVDAKVIVEFSYILKSAHDGEILWQTRQKMTYSPPNNSNTGSALANLIVAAVQAAATKAAPNYIPLTRKANARAIYGNSGGLPSGPHSKQYQIERNEFKKNNATEKK